ncbi:MAG: penicillin-binding transpeptidase domain-containing protein, partial [Bacteroidota bacterium]
VTSAHASHAVGYIREIAESELMTRRHLGYRQGDLVGKAGVEKTYENYLRGRLGSEFKLVNVHGLEVKSYLDGEDDSPPMAGYDLFLGIDSRVQALAESLFVNKRGAAIALDPATGEVIAMVSKPDYNPDIFSQSVDRETWSYLTTSKEKPMLNRATMSVFPPGSTWKPFMALMALAEGDINENSRIHCPGYHPFGGPSLFRCLGVHGSVGLRRAIEVSCNTYFFELMMRSDLNTFRQYGNLFGFGLRAPTDIGEQSAGLMPDSSYFNRMFPRGWTAGYSINLGIGQGNMSVTPLQMARFTSAVANRGTLYPPHLVRELVHAETGDVIRPRIPAPKHIDIDPNYFEVVREGMRLAMEAGTGRRSQIPGITSGGKTGTAQAGTGREDHSIFIMFAPFEDPEIAIAVMVENAGYGGTVAAPIASLMAEQYLKGMIEPSPQRQALMEQVLNIQSEALP